MWAAILSTAISAGLGAVFIASSIPKLRHPRRFAVTVLAYDLLPAPLALTVARVLPVGEMVIGTFLLTGTLSREAGILASFTLAAFGTAIGINVLRGRDIDCGCFGTTTGRRVGIRALLEDAFLLTTAILLAVLSGRWAGTLPWSPLAVVPLAHIGPALCCLALGALAVVFVRALGPLPARSVRDVRSGGKA